jgi:probable O-glycosylation ligase (exosortase A-associated)
MTYGGAVVSLANPYVGLLIYIAFSIIRPEEMWYWSVPVGNYSRIVAVALLLGWVIRGFGNWELGRARAIVAAFVGYWLWGVLSSLQAVNKGAGFDFVESQAKTLLPFLVGVTIIDSVSKLKGLAWTIVLSMGYVAYELNLHYYSGFNRVYEAGGFGGMDNNCVAISMVTGVGLALFLGMEAPRWWQKAAGLLAALLMAHTVMFCFSRGGMMALIITGLVAFFLVPKKPVHYLFFAVAAAICIRLAGADVLHRFATSFADEGERDFSAQSRIILWGNCLDLIGRHPLLGVGPNCFPFVAPEYGWPLGKQAHTLWLTVAAELGIPGLSFLLGFYALCVVRVARFLRSDAHLPDPWLRNLARMVIASIVGFVFAAQFVSLVGLELPFYVVMLGAGGLKLASLSGNKVQGIEPIEPTLSGAVAPEGRFASV